MRYVFDIEANGLREDATKVWILVAKDIDTGKVHQIYDSNGLEHPQVSSWIRSATLLIGHNIINYDIPMMHKFFGIQYEGSIFDTLVVSRLLNPDRRGGHSLARWGEMIGRPKVEHDDWSKYSTEMLDRCVEDVEINYLVYKYLLKEMES